MKEEGTTPQSAAADSSPYILRTEIAFQAIPVLRMAYFTKRPYYGLFVKTHMLQPQAACEGGSRGRGTPQSAAADSSPYILRTDSALRAAPVLRSAYFPKRVHRTLFSKTLDLQPLCGLRKGAEEGEPLSPLRRTAPLTCFSRKRPAKGGAEGGDNLSVWEL